MLNEKNFEKELKELLEKNESVLNEIVSCLNSNDGSFENDVWYDMDMLDDYLSGMSAWEVLRLGYYGWDEHETDGTFNPMRDYFRFNVYGNLESCDYIDYSYLIDDVVEIIMNDTDVVDNVLYVIDDSDELTEIYDNNNYPIEFEFSTMENLENAIELLSLNGYDFIIEANTLYATDNNAIEIETILEENNLI